jgi:hypothetical protein
MTVITFPANTGSIITQIREAIGREVFFYTEVLTDCPTCVLDPITNTSSDAFCPTCFGIGYLVSGEITPILAHITWVALDSLNWQSGGQIFQGDCGLQIEYTAENKDIIDHCKYVIIDGKKAEVAKVILRGVPDINRILIDTKVDESIK